MECLKCSVSGVKLVYMTEYWDEKISARIAICPCCGKEEVIGFGRLY